MKKNPNMTFQGYGRLPLNAESKEEFLALSTFTGEWYTKRGRIMGRPRWYRICLYLFDEGGNPFHSSNVPDQRTDKESLWQLLHYLVDEVMKTYPDKKVCRDSSYAVISVPKRKNK